MYLSAWPLRTMLGPLPISVPVPPMLAAYDTEIFRAQANKRNSLSSLSYISAHFASSISFRGTDSSLLQQNTRHIHYFPFQRPFTRWIGKASRSTDSLPSRSRREPLEWTLGTGISTGWMPFMTTNQQRPSTDTMETMSEHWNTKYNITET